jgi:hypothetical protein
MSAKLEWGLGPLTEKLQKALSRERLGRYVKAAKGDIAIALKLYEINIQISQVLHGVLHGYEIVLRNAMHDQLKAHFHQENWYDRAPLESTQLDMVTKAEQNCGGAVYVPVGKVIAELSLGFWTGLTAARYEQSLWVPCLRRAFPNVKLPRQRMHASLNDIKSLRNRIAHHERILTGNGKLYAGLHPNRRTELALPPETVPNCIGWICQDTADWIKTTSGFQNCLTLLNCPLVKNVNF